MTSHFEILTEGLDLSYGQKVIAQEHLANLRGRYSEPWRHHHDYNHIEEMFDLIVQHKSELRNPNVVCWSTQYHDSIYIPTLSAGLNEAYSGKLGWHNLGHLGLYGLGEEVLKYTEQTAKHEAGSTDTDLQFFLDIDIAILGAKPKRYDRYATDIRTEYSHATDPEYKVARTEALKKLLKRVPGSSPNEFSVFETTILKGLYEAQAQENISREIDMLKK